MKEVELARFGEVTIAFRLTTLAGVDPGDALGAYSAVLHDCLISSAAFSKDKISVVANFASSIAGVQRDSVLLSTQHCIYP